MRAVSRRSCCTSLLAKLELSLPDSFYFIDLLHQLINTQLLIAPVCLSQHASATSGLPCFSNTQWLHSREPASCCALIPWQIFWDKNFYRHFQTGINISSPTIGTCCMWYIIWSCLGLGTHSGFMGQRCRTSNIILTFKREAFHCLHSAELQQQLFPRSSWFEQLVLQSRVCLKAWKTEMGRWVCCCMELNYIRAHEHLP